MEQSTSVKPKGQEIVLPTLCEISCEENLREVKFYTKSDGLSQHCCVIHHVHGTLSDEVLQQANEFSKVLVYRETLESIKDLSKNTRKRQ